VIQEEVSACFVAAMRSDCNILALSSESSVVMRQAENLFNCYKTGLSVCIQPDDRKWSIDR